MRFTKECQEFARVKVLVRLTGLIHSNKFKDEIRTRCQTTRDENYHGSLVFFLNLYQNNEPKNIFVS